MEETFRAIPGSPLTTIPLGYVTFPGLESPTFLAVPAKFMEGLWQAPQLRTSFLTPNGNVGIWALETEASAKLVWEDHASRGLFSGTIYRPEDAIGVEGAINGQSLRFEALLQTGKNTVVYLLVDPASGDWIAYSFPRGEFDALQSLADYLPEVELGVRKFDIEQMLFRCSRVLKSDPNVEAAWFNMGSALSAKKDHAAALRCFQRAFELKPDALNRQGLEEARAALAAKKSWAGKARGWFGLR